MADHQQVNSPDPDTLRHQMEQTRTSLAEKLEVLEQKVTTTIEEATEAVSDTVETVKETVAETIGTVKETVTDTVGTVKNTVASTVEAVRETLDLKAQVQQHPWLMVGGSFAVGFLGGCFLGPKRPGEAALWSPSEAAAEPESLSTPTWSPLSSREFETRGAPRRPGLWDQLLSAFGSEFDKLKGMAIGAIGSAVRDVVTESLPEQFKPRVTDIIQDFTAKLGGEVFPGRVLPETQDQQESPSSTRAGFYS